jgi:hypothetical protein
VNRRELIAAAGATCFAPACVGGAALARPLEEAGLSASLRMGTARRGAGNHRWAIIESGAVTGTLVRGVVVAGRVDWHVDPATGAVEVALQCSIHGDDGRVWTLADRSSGPVAGSLAGGLRLASVPRLDCATDPGPRHPPLAGRMDPRRFAEGVLELRANFA